MVVARVLAVAIAIAAVIDPSVTSARRTKPEIALLGTDSSSSSSDALRGVERALGDDYALIRGPYSKAAATVIVGTAAISVPVELATPVFVVSPAIRGPGVTIEALRAPAVASSESRVPVEVVTRISGAGGRTVVATLIVGGIVVDRVTRPATADGRLTIPLTFVPTTTGAMTARAVVQLEGGRDSAMTDVAVNVRDRRWAVLFFDRRPSWMSTFVRRSLANDPRFVVASRVVTSKGISTEAGSPPSSLEDPTLLELYDAIVVGAPETMTPRDVDGVEAFLRRRGGGVNLLFDARPTSGPYERLTGVARWSASSSNAAAVTAIGTGGANLRASEMIWPTVMPPGAEAIAIASIAGTAPRPIISKTTVGIGQLIVSGALDSWKYRDETTSGFDHFWRAAIASSADGAMPAVEVRPSRSIVRSGERIDLSVRVRDAALAGADRATATVVATLERERTTSAIRLWPSGSIGNFVGSFRAPATPGQYRVTVSANGAKVDVPVVVAATTGRATPDGREILAALAGSRGGGVVAVTDLRAALGRAVRAEPRVERWYPMRSAWWVVPFVVLLGAEWFWRRRAGLG